MMENLVACRPCVSFCYRACPLQLPSIFVSQRIKQGDVLSSETDGQIALLRSVARQSLDIDDQHPAAPIVRSR
jgi:hypothetical protein